MTTGDSGNHVVKIVSGGQTGVDRAALDVAIRLGLPHGGWCPKRRLAEDGQIPARYQLRETQSPQYWVRTEQNVIDSDATLILFRGPMRGGTELTYRMTVKHRRPCLALDFNEPLNAAHVQHWLADHDVHVLNVAGPRESSAAGIGRQTTDFLNAVFSGC